MPVNALGNGVTKTPILSNLSRIVWILNADAGPVAGYSYVWRDTSAWTDANAWKD